MISCGLKRCDRKLFFPVGRTLFFKIECDLRFSCSGGVREVLTGCGRREV